MGHWFQKFVTSSTHGKVSDATIQGYLRSASQIEEIWQQIDDKVDALMAQGMAPWDAYAKMGYALAFVRACRTNVVFVQELLKANVAANPANAGYLPQVTYDQALALCEHIEPYLEQAIKAATNPQYIPPLRDFPLHLGPYVRYANENQGFPLPHLQGSITAAYEMKDWAAGLLAKYELALDAAKTPIPQAVSTHVEAMKSELQLGDFHLRTGVDMVGQISQGQVTNELSVKAEGFLWEAMEGFFKVSQLVANPQASAPPQQRSSGVGGREQVSQSNRSATPPVSSKVTPPPQLPREDIPRVTRQQQDLDKQAVSDMLKQVTADPGATQATPKRSAPDISDILKQVAVEPAAAQGTPKRPSVDVSDMLSQVTAEPAALSGTPTPPSPKASQAAPTGHRPNKSTPRSEDNIMDLLSNISGEQKDEQR